MAAALWELHTVGGERENYEGSRQKPQKTALESEAMFIKFIAIGQKEEAKAAHIQASVLTGPSGPQDGTLSSASSSSSSFSPSSSVWPSSASS